MNRMKSREMASTQVKEVYKSIVEGRAVLRLTSDKVFYNPVQEFNRDLSIAVLSVFTEDFKQYKLSKMEKRKNKVANENLETNSLASDNKDKKVDITILEALSATGLRSIRYAKEVVDATKIIANDISENAVSTIKSNIEFNNVDHIVETSNADACMVMYSNRHRTKRFAAIDLDPYGSPSLFLDAAVQGVADGGMLLVTATDMAVLAGNAPETCYSKYGATSLKTKCCHEMGLRILLQCIESHANRYGRYIEPMLSVSADFYIRVFVKVYTGPYQCKKTISKLAMVYHCVGCDAMNLQPLGEVRPDTRTDNPGKTKLHLGTTPTVGQNCSNCNQKHQLAGPIWAAPIHNEAFVTRVLELVQESPSRFGTAKRLEGVLSVVREELSDAPLYWTLDRLCGTVHSETISMLLFRSALLNAGYKVSFSHANKLSIKTKAPLTLIWDIMRTWVMRHPVKASKVEADPVTKHILSQPVTYKVDLTQREDANPDSRRAKQTRFQFNPTPHWGPGCRATINDGEYKILKSVINENKSMTRKAMHKKRRLPRAAGHYVGNKRTSKQQLVIDTTTSEPESNPETESDKCVSDIVTTPQDNYVGTSEADVHNGADNLDSDVSITPLAKCISTEDKK